MKQLLALINTFNKPFNSSRGAVMIYLAVIIFAAIGISALLIDHSREELTILDLQKAADAAALAAVKEFDGTEYGWRNAKLVAKLLIENNRYFGVDTPLNDTQQSSGMNFSFCLKPGCSGDPLMDDPNNDGSASYTIGESGGLRAAVERGVYWWRHYPNGESKYEFFSLEESDNILNLAGKETGDPDPQIPLASGVPVYTIANAVRVTITATSLDTTIGQIFNVLSFTDLARSSTAVSDEELEECVAPLAIPLCSLFLNTAAGESGELDFRTDGFVADMQCEREMTFTEAQKEVPDRADGLVRSEVFPRPPFNKVGRLNTKALPLYGVLGIPDDNDSGPGATNGQELHSYFRRLQSSISSSRPSSCIKVKRGASFKPLNQIFEDGNDKGQRQLDNTWFDIPGIEQTLAGIINSNRNPTVDQAFSGKPNFPYGRRYRTDLEDPYTELHHIWPLEDSDIAKSQIGVMLMNPIQRDTDYVNPMCHSRFIDYRANIARVAPVNVMIIVPGPNAQQDKNDYCDLKAVIEGSKQNSTAPISDSDPIVVGYAKVNLFDFNIMNLSIASNHQGTHQTPKYVDNNGSTIAIDRNPRASFGDSGEIANEAFAKYISDSANKICLNTWRDAVREYFGCMHDCMAGICGCSTDATPPPGAVCEPEERTCSMESSQTCQLNCAAKAEIADSLRCDKWEEFKKANIKNIDTDDDHDAELEQCVAKCPKDKELDECGCIEALDEEKGNWNRRCFRPIEKYHGLGAAFNNVIRKENPGYLHPFFDSNFKLPDNYPYDYWHEAYWDDPELYYAELALIARILQIDIAQLANVDNVATDLATFNNEVRTPIVVANTIFNFLPDSTGLSVDQRFDKFRKYFDHWYKQLRNIDSTNPTLVDNAVDIYLGGFPVPPNYSFPTWVPEENSLIINEVAKIFNENLAAYGLPNYLPTLPGSPNRNAVRAGLEKIGSPLTLRKRESYISLPATHCLPRKRDNIFPSDSPTSWEQPRVREAQYGCGGIRARLECMDSNNPTFDLTSSRPPQLRRPMLVQ